MSKWAISAAFSFVLAAGSASAQIVVVDGSNLDIASTTEGVKNGSSGLYFQGFRTGSSATGDISLLTLDLFTEGYLLGCEHDGIRSGLGDLLPLCL